MSKQNEVTNPKIKQHTFLEDMYEDEYFPNHLVDKGTAILIDLCIEIEQKKPTTLEELYKLTHNATEKFNELQEEFEDEGSEIETDARASIAEGFEFIAIAYGFENADIEELIATRDW